MAFCNQCGNEIKDTAQFCNFCGSKQSKKVKYCEDCGKEVHGEANLCTSCENNREQNVKKKNRKIDITHVIKTISNREKLVGIFWLVIATLQVISFFWGVKIICMSYKILKYTDLLIPTTMNYCFLGGIAAANFIVAYKSLKFSNDILLSPVGIMKRYARADMYGGVILYNAIILIIIIFSGNNPNSIEDLQAFGSINIYTIAIITFAIEVSILSLIGVYKYAKEYEHELKELELQELNEF